MDGPALHLDLSEVARPLAVEKAVATQQRLGGEHGQAGIPRWSALRKTRVSAARRLFG